jgi:hypothetical protein
MEAYVLWPRAAPGVTLQELRRSAAVQGLLQTPSFARGQADITSTKPSPPSPAQCRMTPHFHHMMPV